MIFLRVLMLAVGASAESVPAPEELFRRVIQAPAVVFSGRVRAEGADGPARLQAIKYAPGGRLRREILGEDGRPLRLTVSDGKLEWTQDLKSGRHWSGPPAEPWQRRLGPDETQRVSAAYEMTSSTGERVAGRDTWVLELRPRTGARLGRRLWVDRVHGLVLRSRTLRPEGEKSLEAGFEAISFPEKPDPAWFKFVPPAGEPAYARAQADEEAMAEARRAGLDPKLPAWLPSGFVFEGLKVLSYRKGKRLIHFRFSDGAGVVSLFQCPPRSRLDFGKRPKEKVRVAGGPGYLSWTEEGNLLGWGTPGARMVLVGPLGLDELKRVAESIR